MAQIYLDKLSNMMAEIASEISQLKDLEIKHFFSGAAAYVDGRIFLSLTPAGFALKLPDGLRKELTRDKGAKYLRYFPKSPIKKNYVVLPMKILDDKDMLYFWVEKSIEYVLTLPKPNNKSTKS